MSNPLAVLDRPKFQFNVAVLTGMAARFGIVRQGRADHCINRPVQINRRAYGMAGLMQIVEGTFAPEFRQAYTCTIGRKG